jgi:hypothetical protein
VPLSGDERFDGKAVDPTYALGAIAKYDEQKPDAPFAQAPEAGVCHLWALTHIGVSFPELWVARFWEST